MRRILLLSSLLVGLVAFGSKPANAAISLDIHVGDRAPVAYVYEQPRGYFVPDYNVWYYQNSDYDMYRYGNVWYMNDGGYWYSSRSWRGPFVGVRYASVPTQIIRIPSRYHRQTRGYWQQAPRQQAWNQNQWNQPRYRDSDRRDNREWSRNDDDRNDHRKNGRGHGHGNNGRGRGHGHDDDND